jgi:drug/metabolite transporter (DMT)-like permease
MSPVWSALIGFAFLGERLTPARLAALALSLGGLFVILGGRDDWPWPANAGDWLALISGMLWSLGSFRLYRAPEAPLGICLYMTLAGGVLVALALLALLPTAEIGSFPSPAQWERIALPLLAISGLLLMPLNGLAIWGAQRVSPTRIGILLMLDVVVGVSSAALFSGEPFGWREGGGALLVMMGAAAEIIFHAPAPARYS